MEVKMTLEQFRERYFPTPYINFTQEDVKEFERNYGLSLFKEVDLAIEMEYNHWFPPSDDNS